MALPKNPKVDLKAKYQRTFEIGLIISLSFLIFAFKFFPEIERAKIEKDKPQDIVTVEDIPQTVEETLPPPPPRPEPVIENITEDETLDDYEFEETVWDENDVVSAPPPPPPIKDEEEEVPFTYFEVVEQQPLPIGGMESIHARICYPETAQKAGLQGKVYVKAFVDEKGIVQKVELIKGIGGGCDEEILRVVKETKFEPGRQRGRPVKVQVAMSFLFKLN
ncbi:MAG: energy transducer TonB [Ignavibacteria bacterium]|jgi:protein TonB